MTANTRLLNLITIIEKNQLIILNAIRKQKADSITDKFPFSLPFDIYNLVTIFVRDEQKPIFEIPIQTTLDIAGDDYKVDEKIVLDLTQFQLNGVDIIRVFTRTVTYIAFIAFLIKITPHVIKH